MKLISWNVNGFRAALSKGFQEAFYDLDADIFMVAEGIKEFCKEPLARIVINKVQQGSSVASAEGQTHVAIHAPDFGLINQRWRIIRPGSYLIRIADE